MHTCTTISCMYVQFRTQNHVFRELHISFLHMVILNEHMNILQRIGYMQTVLPKWKNPRIFAAVPKQDLLSCFPYWWERPEFLGNSSIFLSSHSILLLSFFSFRDIEWDYRKVNFRFLWIYWCSHFNRKRRTRYCQ